MRSPLRRLFCFKRTIINEEEKINGTKFTQNLLPAKFELNFRNSNLIFAPYIIPIRNVLSQVAEICVFKSIVNFAKCSFAQLFVVLLSFSRNWNNPSMHSYDLAKPSENLQEDLNRPYCEINEYNS